MNRLQDYALYDISWNLSPEHAVTMYLEWGNNDWHSEYPPVRSKEDVSHYFVVDSWGKEPVIRLVRRNSETLKTCSPCRCLPTCCPNTNPCTASGAASANPPPPSRAGCATNWASRQH